MMRALTTQRDLKIKDLDLTKKERRLSKAE